MEVSYTSGGEVYLQRAEKTHGAADSDGHDAALQAAASLPVLLGGRSVLTRAQRVGLVLIVGFLMLMISFREAGLHVDHSAALQWYDHEIGVHPLRTKSLTAGLICVIGDLLCQHVVEERKAKTVTLATVGAAGGKLQARLARPKMSWRRVVRFASCGICLTGPIYHYWFALLFDLFPDHSGAAAVLTLVAADQLLMVRQSETRPSYGGLTSNNGLIVWLLLF